MKCSYFFVKNYFDITDDNIILSTIRIYGSEIKGDYYQISSEELSYVIISDELSKKIRIIPNSTYSSYMIYYNCVEENKRNNDLIIGEIEYFSGEYFDVYGNILLNSIQMFEFSQVDRIINLVPYVIISNKFSNKIRIVPYSDCKNYMIINKYIDQ